VVSVFGVVRLDASELNTMPWCAIALGRPGSPFHFHLMFSSCYGTSDPTYVQNLTSLVLTICRRDLLRYPTEVKGTSFPRNGSVGLHRSACKETLHCRTFNSLF